MEETYITIAGTGYYYGNRPFSIGKVVRCIKEPDNPYDRTGNHLQGTGQGQCRQLNDEHASGGNR